MYQRLAFDMQQAYTIRNRHFLRPGAHKSRTPSRRGN